MLMEMYQKSLTHADIMARDYHLSRLSPVFCIFDSLTKKRRFCTLDQQNRPDIS